MSSTAARFTPGRFVYNGRVALALLPALAVVAGGAERAVLGLALVRERERERERDRERRGGNIHTPLIIC